jgi:hypothetical protein
MLRTPRALLKCHVFARMTSGTPARQRGRVGRPRPPQTSFARSLSTRGRGRHDLTAVALAVSIASRRRPVPPLALSEHAFVCSPRVRFLCRCDDGPTAAWWAAVGAETRALSHLGTFRQEGVGRRAHDESPRLGSARCTAPRGTRCRSPRASGADVGRAVRPRGTTLEEGDGWRHWPRASRPSVRCDGGRRAREREARRLAAT